MKKNKKPAFSFTTPSPRMQIVNKQNQSPQWIESILVNICRLYIWGISYSKILDDKDNKKKYCQWLINLIYA